MEVEQKVSKKGRKIGRKRTEEPLERSKERMRKGREEIHVQRKMKTERRWQSECEEVAERSNYSKRDFLIL